MNYVRKLGFEETPDYDFLRELFSKVLKTLGEPDDGVFDWMLLNGGKGWEASQRAKVSESEVDLLSSRSYFCRLRQQRHHIPPTANTDIATRSAAVLHGNHCRTSTRRQHPSLSVLHLPMSSRPGDLEHRTTPDPMRVCNHWHLAAAGLVNTSQLPRGQTPILPRLIHTLRRQTPQLTELVLGTGAHLLWDSLG